MGGGCNIASELTLLQNPKNETSV